MTLSTEDAAEIRRVVRAFKAAQAERKPTTVAEELDAANEVLQRLLDRYGEDACPAVNRVLDAERRRAARRPPVQPGRVTPKRS